MASLLLALLGLTSVSAAPPISAAKPSLARLPLAFEPNHGQGPSEARFVARLGALKVELAPRDWRLALPGGELTMRLLGARKDASMRSEAPLAGRVSYFVGRDPSKWQRDLPTFGRIVTQSAYPGIDVVHYGNGGRLEHDFIVRPGGDPSRIAVGFTGARPRLMPSGDLALGGMRQLRPVAYQTVTGRRVPVPARYVVRNGTVRFALGRYDRARTLVIDPVLSYSSYLGGVGYDAANAIAVDASGAAYVVGNVGSTGFPFTAGAFRAPNATDTGTLYGFVAKINPQGTGLVYCANIGGAGPNGVAVDAAGNAYVTGAGGGPAFPGPTPGTFGTAPYGGDAFVLKLNPSGTGLVYSSLFGGTTQDIGNAIAVNAAGEAAVVGTTSYASPGAGDFPVVNAFQPAYGGGHNDAFVVKLNAAGSAAVFSTYLGGGQVFINNNDDWGTGVGYDAAGNVYAGGMTYSPDFPVTPGAFDTTWNGLDGFVTKFTPTGGLVYSTFLGGVGHEEQFGLAVDAQGSAVATGFSNAADFPTTPGAYQRVLKGAQDAYVAKLTPDGSGLVFGTYLGGTNLFERGWSVALDPGGNVWVAGDINEVGASVYDFPVLNPVQTGPGRGLSDAFVAQFSPTGGLLFSTYLGGNLSDQARGIALDPAGNAYVTGSTDSFNFPSRAGSFRTANAGGLNSHDDAFVLKLGVGTTVAPALASYTISPASVPAGSNAVGTVSLNAAAPASGATITLLTNSPVVNLPASVTIPAGATSVRFTIGTQVPSSTTTATLGARYGNVTVSAPLTVTVATVPALSSVSVNPATVVGGATAQGTVALTAPAPTGGISIPLSTSSTRITLPASVVVPAGSSSATFPIGTSAVTATTSTDVVATYLGVSKSAILTLTASTTPPPTADRVSIIKAEWKGGKLVVEATSNNAAAKLTAYSPTGAAYGALSGSGGRYKGAFTVSARPASVTVKSSLGGSATRNVN